MNGDRITQNTSNGRGKTNTKIHLIDRDRQTQNTLDSESKKYPGAGWVGGLVEFDFITRPGSHQSSA